MTQPDNIVPPEKKKILVEAVVEKIVPKIQRPNMMRIWFPEWVPTSPAP